MLTQIHSAIFLILLMTVPAAAQDAGSAQPGDTSKQFFDVNFQGGTVDDYVALLRTLNPQARILCSNSAARIYVPSIKMKSVPLEIAVDALTLVTQNSFDSIVINQQRFEGADQNVELIFAIDLNAPAEEAPMEATVINANSALQSFDAENAAKNLEATINMGLLTVFDGNEGPAVVVKLHEPTGLLFIKGPGQRVQFVLKIIEQLSQNANPVLKMTEQLPQNPEQ